MVAPPFGFSVGDFIAGGQLLVEVIKAFKEAGGASSKYASEVSFLNSLKLTLEHLDKFVSNTINTQSNSLTQDVSKLLQEIREPWEEFKRFLDKYERSLGASSSRSKLGKAPRTVQFTMKDISGKVEKLRRQIEQPLQAVNSLLSLHVIQSLEKLPDQLFQPAQCAQLVEAITLADIPTELDKQIQALQLAANEHNIKQDEQLQIIKTLRTQLEERIAGLQTVLDNVKVENSAAKDRHNEQLDTSKRVHNLVDELSAALESKSQQLESDLKEQKQLVLALKSFLEDKSSRSEPSVECSGERVAQSSIQRSWPSATLSTAYLAALLLSSVLSSITATSVVNRTQRRGLNGSRRPAFLPMDYSLPGLGTLENIPTYQQFRQPVIGPGIFTSQKKTAVSIRDKPSAPTFAQVLRSSSVLEISSPSKEPELISAQDNLNTSSLAKISKLSSKDKSGGASQAKVSEWLGHWSTRQTTLQKPKDQRSHQLRVQPHEQVTFPSLSPGWSQKLSKLNEPTPDDPNDGGNRGSHDSGRLVGNPVDNPGPIAPPVTNDDIDWRAPSGSGGGSPSGRGGYGGGNAADRSSDSDSPRGGGGYGGGYDSDSS